MRSIFPTNGFDVAVALWAHEKIHEILDDMYSANDKAYSEGLVSKVADILMDAQELIRKELPVTEDLDVLSSGGAPAQKAYKDEELPW